MEQEYLKSQCHEICDIIQRLGGSRLHIDRFFLCLPFTVFTMQAVCYCCLLSLFTTVAIDTERPNPQKHMLLGPYARVDYTLMSLCPLQRQLQHIYHAWATLCQSRPETYARVDFIPQSGTLDLASVVNQPQVSITPVAILPPLSLIPEVHLELRISS